MTGSTDKKTPPSVVSSDLPLFDPETSTRGLSTGVTVGGTGSSLVQTTGDSAPSVIGSADKKTPPSVVSSDLPFFDPGTSTRGLSTGVTVGGTGSSLVQTTGEAALRVHQPEAIFDPGATTSSLAREYTGPSLDQAPGEAVGEMQTAAS